MSVDNSPSKRGGRSTQDLLSWSDKPDANQVRTPVRFSATNDSKGFTSATDQSCRDSPHSRPGIRTHQPAGGVSTIAFGDQLSLEEADALLKRRPGSESKRREMSGNKIFSDDGNNGSNLDNLRTPDRTGIKMHQANGSQILFGDGNVSPKKGSGSATEAAKQRELSGSQETFDDIQPRRPFSNAKAKEMSGSNIFGPPSEVSSSYEDNVCEPVAPASPIKWISDGGGVDSPDRRKLHNQKMAELSGNNIFENDHFGSHTEKSLSAAKRREMSGSDIFADDKPVPRDCVGGIRKPPGGESTIALI